MFFGFLEFVNQILEQAHVVSQSANFVVNCPLGKIVSPLYFGSYKLLQPGFLLLFKLTSPVDHFNFLVRWVLLQASRKDFVLNLILDLQFPKTALSFGKSVLSMLTLCQSVSLQHGPYLLVEI